MRNALIALVSALAFPWSVLAQTPSSGRFLQVRVGSSLSAAQILENIMTFMAATIVVISIAMFMMGAFYMVLTPFDEGNVEKAKKLIFGSLIGMAVVLGAYAITRVVYYFVFDVPPI